MQVFSVCDLPIPASTSTPTFDFELGIEVYLFIYYVIPATTEVVTEDPLISSSLLE